MRGRGGRRGRQAGSAAGRLQGWRWVQARTLLLVLRYCANPLAGFCGCA
jgi:hypothetical protein